MNKYQRYACEYCDTYGHGRCKTCGLKIFCERAGGNPFTWDPNNDFDNMKDAYAYINHDIAVTNAIYDSITKKNEPKIKKVIWSGNKTIVIWEDGTKTMVSKTPGDFYDPYAAFCAAIVKKLYGNSTRARKAFEEFYDDPRCNHLPKMEDDSPGIALEKVGDDVIQGKIKSLCNKIDKILDLCSDGLEKALNSEETEIKNMEESKND